MSNVLNKIQECVRKKKLRIEFNREKNEIFSEKYNMDICKISKIILKLKTKNFCEAYKSKNGNNIGHILYIFGISENLKDIYGDYKYIEIYSKFDLLSGYNGDITIVVSFHEAEYPLKYAFR